MNCFGRKSDRNAPLRAVLACFFLLIAVLQPSFSATAGAVGFHGESQANAPLESAASELDDHGNLHKAGASQSFSSIHDHAGSAPDEKSCEVHCAPAQAVPVELPVSTPVLSRCFGPAVLAVLQPGEHPALIRPPRNLG